MAILNDKMWRKFLKEKKKQKGNEKNICRLIKLNVVNLLKLCMNSWF